ncbi:MAG: endolytic transglycosylase MltG [Lachnospiraceae bacterium]|nr:endolytic transglycosylase MltG [Lachnospiraceae bacterium]MBQ7601025.1 endolytic transglycosylase MltG [Lachnospiraceae bacterium]MBR5340218.1 endolytic transglycosylase MltG [Lachnospiraceae bacterium]
MEKRKAQKQERPKQKQDAFHYLKFAIMVLFIAMVALLAVFGYRFGEALFSDEAVSEPGQGVEYTLQVEPRESVLTIGTDLREHGIIRSAAVFFIQSRLYSLKIDPGTYKVSSDQSSKAILRMLNQKYEENRRKQ